MRMKEMKSRWICYILGGVGFVSKHACMISTICIRKDQTKLIYIYKLKFGVCVFVCV